MGINDDDEDMTSQPFLFVPKETAAHEARVALVPDHVPRLTAMGWAVHVAGGAGASAGYGDDAYKEKGATIVKAGHEGYEQADMIIGVRAPFSALEEHGETPPPAKGAYLCALFQPHRSKALDFCARHAMSAFALERVPRITRAQSMDVLSSQSNIAGYGAVIFAAYHLSSMMPMMMTAAGSIAPARCLIIGAGVAGLQAIATAKRLGSIVSAMDVRPTVKRQVESVGGTFLEPQGLEQDAQQGETTGGYAQEMTKDYQKKQQALLKDVLPQQDIVITTALIPDKPAPTIITDDMVKTMKSGSIIIDMAADAGGNCALTKPYLTTKAHGVTIMGQSNLASCWAYDASRLFSRNITDFVACMFAHTSSSSPLTKETMDAMLCRDDAIVSATLITAKE
ncbi:MAG: NAD(P) transhydrogenase subunit alpha [Alphaproteobacteria bacterium GM7ARS4]|nr:NAD(P) transhydrogenase subunit alpha [Alphaproteobacteria bacterium GM7ARS4]